MAGEYCVPHRPVLNPVPPSLSPVLGRGTGEAVGGRERFTAPLSCPGSELQCLYSLPSEHEPHGSRPRGHQAQVKAGITKTRSCP